MASVHLGRLLGPVGFARTVAIKRLHPHLAGDQEFVRMFVDEARMAARIQHPNVVAMLDVVLRSPELFLVMEYVHGESLARLARAARERGEPVSLRIISAILAGALHGLHAAHEAKSERGEPMRLVHRDVSPQNLLVGVDGVVRIADFGVAKAIGRLQTTRGGQLKGKAAYLAPEQVAAAELDRRADVYAASVVLWELLTGRCLFQGDSPLATMRLVMQRKVEPPSRSVPSLPKALDDIVMHGLAINRENRFATAREMAIELEQAIPPATPREVGEWVEVVAAEELSRRADRVAEIESASFNEDVEGLESLRRKPPASASEDVPTVQGFIAPIELGSSNAPASSSDERVGSARRHRVRAVSALLFAFAVAAAAWGWHRRAAPAPPVSAAPPPDAPQASAPRAVAARAASTSTVENALATASPASARERAAADSAGNRRRVRHARSGPTRREAKRPNCADPFVWTSDGRKVPRPECF